MEITREQQAAREALFRAIMRCRTRDVAQAIENARGWAGVHCLAGLPSLHLAAALSCTRVVRMLVAAGAPVNAFLAEPLASVLCKAPFLASLRLEQRQGLDSPGLTALAVACRASHTPTVEALLELGANPNLSGPGQPESLQPHTPLECAAQGRGLGVTMASKRRLVGALLAAGADPLASAESTRRIALRWFSAYDYIGLEMILAHLEQRRGAGQLVLPCGKAATDLMIVAAQKGCLGLFAAAHEYLLAACGLRWRQQESAAAAAPAGERGAARRSRNSDGSSSSDDGDGGFGGDVGAEAPAWQPTAVELRHALSSAVQGGCLAILRSILASPLPFSLSDADAEGSGLLARCALSGGSAPAFAALHAAGARLSLSRLLCLLYYQVQPERLAWLLALQRPAVSQELVLSSSPALPSWACPIHYVLSLWQDGRERRERTAIALLEVLVAAGYRPTVWHSLPQLVRAPDGTLVSAGTRFDPFDHWRETSDADRRLRLVAQGGSWSTEAHRLWPEAFKAATRTLLLANRARHEAAWADSGALRRGGNRLPPGADLASLPPELLPRILSAAAWPMSAWL